MKTQRRRFVSLLTALSFLVLAVTGVLAFIRPFSIAIVGLHALIGFVFVGLVALHVANNFNLLSNYLRSRTFWLTLAITTGLTALFLWQPAPIRGILAWSENLGPALDRFEMREDGLTYHYSPASSYKMELAVRAGKAFDAQKPPDVAIWLENASFYHIKTLHSPADTEQAGAALPYWAFKVRGWKEARRKADQAGQSLDAQNVDGVSTATQNSSFDPADYILPAKPGAPSSYRLLIEINQRGDEQPSLVYAVEIDNADPRAFQLLELVGYPKREEEGEDKKEAWSLFYVDERFGSALSLIDSALLTIDRD